MFDIHESSNGIGHYHSISVVQHISQFAKEVKGFDSFRIDLVHFGYTEYSCLTHIRIFILRLLDYIKGILKRIAKIINDLFYADTTHSPDSQTAH
jgi:hypothetical protein